MITGDSLDLLLDTMCNTFGGVMFIAIALVVISFFIPKMVLDIDEDANATAKVEALQAKITELQQQLRKMQLERSLKEQLIAKFKNHPHLDKIIEFGKLKDDNEKLLLLTSEVKAKKQAFLVAFKKENKKLKTQTAILTQQQIKLRELSDAKTIQNKKIKDNKAIIAKFVDADSPPETRTIGISPRTKTDLSPFIMIMNNNKLYRVHKYTEESLFDGKKFDNCDDVNVAVTKLTTPENKEIKAITIQPATSKGLFINPKIPNKVILQNLFKDIDKQKRFIWVMVNKDSFNSFIKVRKFLRENQYKLYWYPVVNKYYLTLTDQAATYEAGE